MTEMKIGRHPPYFLLLYLSEECFHVELFVVTIGF